MLPQFPGSLAQFVPRETPGSVISFHQVDILCLCIHKHFPGLRQFALKPRHLLPQERHAGIFRLIRAQRLALTVIEPCRVDLGENGHNSVQGFHFHP